ncbi:MAG: hypothetical protein E7578_06215 [Ruminococcaceae bacterium]|nr:hypothetical protein [Oscillospiraceae bacterium]
MSTRDTFIDAMGIIDDELLTSHLRRKCPTKTQKIQRYVMAAAIYAAACLVFIAVLPLIIGKDKAPTPPDLGDAPIVIETVESIDATETYIFPPEPIELPTATTVFEGCEFTIVLDKPNYALDDTIHVTVTLENKSDKDVGLWKGHLGHFLDGVGFYENGEWRWSYSSDWDKGYSDAIRSGPIESGALIVYEVEFTPGAPNDASDPVASMDSLWEIRADVQYYLNPEDRVEYENVKTATVTIEVPHSGDSTTETTPGSNVTEIDPIDTEDIPIDTEDITDPEPDVNPEPSKIEVGIAGKTVVLYRGSADYSRFMNSFNSLEYYIHSQAELLYGIRGGGYKNILNKGIYAELVYDGNADITLDGVTIPKARRVLVSLGNDSPLVVLSGSDDYNSSSSLVGYLAYDSPEILNTVWDIVYGNNTPRKTVEQDGLRYTAILDRSSYTINDPVRVTLVLENKGSDPITLRRLSSVHFLSDVWLCVLSECVPRIGENHKNPDGSVVFETLYPGDVISYTEWFDVSDAYLYSKWQISAGFSYYIGMIDTDDFDNRKKVQMNIDVPRNMASDEAAVYPESYISKQTTTSVTKTVFGCEYTITIDKPKYEMGDTVKVKVSFENKGKTLIYLGGQHMYDVLDYVSFLVNGKGTFEVGGPPIESTELVAPGDSHSYTVEFDTSEAKLTGVWSVKSRIEFYAYGEKQTESVEIEVPHDGADPTITENEALSAVAKKHGVTVEYLCEREFGVRGADIECSLVSKGDKSIYRVTFIELLTPPRNGDNFTVGLVETPLNGNTTDIRLYNGFEYYGYRYTYDVDATNGEILGVNKTFSGDVEGTPVSADPTVDGSVAYEYYAFFSHSMEFIDDYGIMKTSRYTKNKDKLGDSGHLPILEFRNSSQFTEFSDDIENYLELTDKPSGAGMHNFLYQKERFGKEFFDKNRLYLVGLRGTCSAYNHYFNSVTVKNGKLEFEILTEMDHSNSWINEDISVYVLFAVPKDQLTDVTSVDCINPYSYRYD